MKQTTPRLRASQTGLNAAIAATLNGERVTRRLTFDQLAAKTDIPTRSLKRYLSSRDRDITVPIMGRLADALGLTTVEIMRRAEQLRADPPPSVDPAQTG